MAFRQRHNANKSELKQTNTSPHAKYCFLQFDALASVSNNVTEKKLYCAGKLFSLS